MSAFARSYARAALQSAAPGYDFAKLIDTAGSVAKAIDGTPKLKEFFSAPGVPKAPKERALEALAQRAEVDEFGRRFLRIILDHGRLTKLAEILAAVSAEFDRTTGTNQAHVTVAAPITPEEERRISEALAKSFGGNFRLAVAVDQTILGGFVARVRSRLIDASVAGAIGRFQEQGKESSRA